MLDKTMSNELTKRVGVLHIRLFLLCISILLATCPVFATNEIAQDKLKHLEDSLFRELDAMPRDSFYLSKIVSLELLFMDSSRMYHYADLKEKEALKQNDMRFVCEAYSDKAIFYANRGNVDSFYFWKNKMDPLALELKEFNYYFFLNNLEVMILVNNLQIEKAILVAKRMYETAKKYDSTEGLIASEMSLGKALESAKRYKEALASYEKALSQIPVNTNSWKAWQINIYTGLVSCCDKSNNDEKGLKYVEEMEELIDGIKETKLGEGSDEPYLKNQWAELQLRKSHFYTKLGKYAEASKELAELKRYYSKLTEKDQRKYHQTLTDFYEAKGEYDKALSEFNVVETYYEKSDITDIPDLVEQKARLYDKLGNKADALDLYKRVISMKDSINSAWFDSQLNELRTIHDLDALELKNKELELKNKHEQLTALLVCVLLLIVTLTFITVLYIRLSRVKKALEHSQAQLMKEKDLLIQSQEELRIAKERAEEARDLALKAERKESFFANMSHEIRTPLNAIVGFSNLLVEGEEEIDPEDRSLFINTINQNCDQLLKLVNDVLDLSRMESDKMQFTFGDFNLSEVVTEIYSTHKMMIPNGLDFIKDIPSVPVFAHVDKGRLKQVLSNFINNAVKFTYHGYIKVGYEFDNEARQIRLFVEDTGRGIPEEHQKKIFERFYKQVDTDQGTGLGLSICSVIAEKLGGRLELESEEGKGSRFSIILPYSEKLNQRN